MIFQHRQDYFLKAILLMACSAEEKQLLDQGQREMVHPLSKSIFSGLPQANTVAVRVLLRTLSGLEDFARWNAYYPRRAIHPDIHHDKILLFVFVNSPRVATDSEWHVFCECPGISIARNFFCLIAKSEISCSDPCSTPLQSVPISG